MSKKTADISRWKFAELYLPDLDPLSEAFGKFKIWLVKEENKAHSKIKPDILEAMRVLIDQKENIEVRCHKCGEPIADVVYHGGGEYWHKECGLEVDLEKTFTPDVIKFKVMHKG